MGQLIKLQDYISRYETDVYRYTSEFIRLKKRQWEQTKEQWESNKRNDALPQLDETWEWLVEEPSLFEKMKKWFKRSSPQEEETTEAQTNRSIDGEEGLPPIVTEAKNIDELKILFLENIFQLQLKWASSTIWYESAVDKKFYYEEKLKYFLQRFPDTYLCLYKPVFLVKNAPVELDVILLSPTTTWCITFAEGAKDNIIIASSDRFWAEIINGEEKKMVNPSIALQRMGKIVADIYKQYNVDFPIKKAVINRYGYIDYRRSAFSDVHVIDKRNYEQWFSSLRKLAIPLKHAQLKAASCLLRHCSSHYDIRTDWNTDEEKV
ncbi:NERD domain-containing protein [Parageobacillus thermoglucosidasius]|uniref:Glucanohydrolase n=1 Tax=Parageobacillus thermoglucosidasius TaxID=1426 RepID=A0AAN1D8F4_PARTM|nr:NERD domain-containing protein [Parageobacillus thermoglucosidasius]ALF11852.1 glucanohydrolase [Parageobacillus thermoglucosidasius]ANZ31936.1 glucanohydrolase [Parageobacillus thermoglucosidasius]APM82670.1 glucanohydrolase [Parageobacillus thermoglucosidasius]KJX69775.1 glucanohydrolase [Parageobacillus thermoglucosidasius]RDE26408.1 NERD domain-containing protein [Parageobacillus thermoglucosidasius]